MKLQGSQRTYSISYQFEIEEGEEGGGEKWLLDLPLATPDM